MTRKTTLPDPWRQLAARNGGPMKLATKLGIDHATLWRWAHAKMVPTEAQQAFLFVTFEAYGLPRPEFK